MIKKPGIFASEDEWNQYDNALNNIYTSAANDVASSRASGASSIASSVSSAQSGVTAAQSAAANALAAQTSREAWRSLGDPEVRSPAPGCHAERRTSAFQLRI